MHGIPTGFLPIARGLTCRYPSRMLYKRYSIVSLSDTHFRGGALRVSDKHSRRVVCSQAHAPQPCGWTQAQIETEHRVRDREKAKITLPSPEHLKRIMRDAPSLEDVMKESTS